MKKNTLIISILLVTAFYLITKVNSFDGTNVENHVNKLFTAKNRDNNLKNIIRVIPQIDWAKYNKEYNNGFEVLYWLFLKHEEIVTENEILSVLKGTNNLDGALSEAYSNLVGSIFINSQSEFINALSKLDSNQSDLVLAYLKYYFEYMDKPYKEELIKSLKNYYASDENVHSALTNIIKILEE